MQLVIMQDLEQDQIEAMIPDPRVQVLPIPPPDANISAMLAGVARSMFMTPSYRKVLLAMAGVPCCRRCGEAPAYEGALFCGAACSAQWEGGDRSP